MDPVERYLFNVAQIRASGGGVKETSYYPALDGLLNEVGNKVKPRVSCVITIANIGAGIPAAGLFTAEQLRRDPGAAKLDGKAQPPARGVVEAKPPSEAVDAIKDSRQVAKYLARYGQVLVTNFRSFLLVGQDESGAAVALESYSLATTEAEFWVAASRSHETAKMHADGLTDFLIRVMLRPAPLTEPKDLAWFLASYARDALRRIDLAPTTGLDPIKSALEEALGLTFEGERGEHFFRSTLVQTLFCGIFSSWVLWSKSATAAGAQSFEWRTAAWTLGVPMIEALFSEIAKPGILKALDLVEVLDWAGATLNRVDRGAFFKSFEKDQAVQYFHEPFLEAFDPQLRKDLGVWYTPAEIVRYMVARVDNVLRTELEIEDGLADDRVYVLDPCCGTGTFLVEVLKTIHATLLAKGGDALTAGDVKRAAMERVFGFEILPAPFVVAHLQLGLLLQEIKAPLSHGAATSERAGVYLTNALTGWEPPEGAKQRLPMLELEQERDAAERVKRETPILVVLGNPPYNAYAGVSPEEEHGLVDPYRTGLRQEWGINRPHIDDLYVRFFRIAERRIAEQTGQGVVCYISNFSYLRDPSFVVMRRRLLAEFDALWIDNLNGDSRETGKTTPEGLPDPSAFSTPRNREGIRVGTAVSLMVRREVRAAQPEVNFRQFWGTEKLAALEASLASTPIEVDYQTLDPRTENRFSIRSSGAGDNTDDPQYRSWPTVAELANFGPGLGVLENRKDDLTDIDRPKLEERLRYYLDPSSPVEGLRTIVPGLMRAAARFDPERARARALAAGSFDTAATRRFLARPMDARWCYYTPVRPVWNEPRPDYTSQCWTGNISLVTRRKAVASPEGATFFVASILGNQHAFLKDAYYIPLRLRSSSEHPSERAPGKNREASSRMPPKLSLSPPPTSPNPRASTSPLWASPTRMRTKSRQGSCGITFWRLATRQRTLMNTLTRSEVIGRESLSQTLRPRCARRPRLDGSLASYWTPSVPTLRAPW